MAAFPYTSTAAQSFKPVSIQCQELIRPGGLSLEGPWRVRAGTGPLARATPDFSASPYHETMFPVRFDTLRSSIPLDAEIAEGWLLLEFPIDCGAGPLGVRVENATSALRLDFFEEQTNILTVKLGTLGTSEDTEVPLWLPVVHKIPAVGGPIWVRYQVSNFHHARGGFTFSPVLAPYKDLESQLQWERLRDMGLFGFILMMCVYHCILYALRRKDLSSLAFALLCFTIAVRHLVTSRFIPLAISEPSRLQHDLLVRSEYISMYLALLGFAFFIWAILPRPWYGRFTKGLAAIIGTYTLITLVVSPPIFTSLIFGFYVVLVISCFVALTHLVRMVKEGESAAWAVLGGILIVVSTALFDVTKTELTLDLPYVLGYGLGAFLLVQSFLLAKRFADAQEAVESSLVVAEEASRLKSEFLANMSHELRTPLNAIVNIPRPLLEHFNTTHLWACAGCDSVFEDDDEPDPDAPAPECPECGWTLVPETSSAFVGDVAEHTKFLKRIERSGRHLLNVINDLLDFSKLDAGKMMIYPEEHAFGSLLRDALATLESLAEQKSIDLTLEDADAPESVFCDHLKVTQVLVNLTGNAVKFTPEGGRVTVRARCREDGWAVLEVEDSGIGIAEEDLATIFESFRQADGSHTRKHQGTGLGLAISKKIVELHGGELSVASEVSKGSTFTIALPPARQT